MLYIQKAVVLSRTNSGGHTEVTGLNVFEVAVFGLLVNRGAIFSVTNRNLPYEKMQYKHNHTDHAIVNPRDYQSFTHLNCAIFTSLASILIHLREHAPF